MLDQLGRVEEPIAPRVLYESLVFHPPGWMRKRRHDFVVHIPEYRLVRLEGLGTFRLDCEHVPPRDEAVKRRRRSTEPSRALDLEVCLAAEGFSPERQGLFYDEPRPEDIGRQARR